MVVGGEAQLVVSRSKYIRLEVCKSLHIDNRMCFELSTFFWTARGCVDGLVFMVCSYPR